MFRSFCLLFLFTTLYLGCIDGKDAINLSPDLSLLFSTDTLTFDTLLTERTSITKRMRVINNNKDAVLLDEISVGGGKASPYQVIINGRIGQMLEGEVLQGGDSLLILVQVTIDPTDQNLPFLVKDSLLVAWNGNQSDIKLVAWGQDAHYVSQEIFCDDVWVSDKPYVIQDIVMVDSLCKLEIEKGTKIYFDKEAKLIVKGELIVNGDSGSHVIFRNARFDEQFMEAPGQWSGIFFYPGSSGVFSYTIIENARDGIFAFGSSDRSFQVKLSIDHSILRFMSSTGIKVFDADVDMTNSLVYDCGEYLAAHFSGGRYRYDHCTLVNQPSTFIREQASLVFLDNYPSGGEDPFQNPLSIVLKNSIVWGVQDEELYIGNDGGQLLDAKLMDNIIRSTETLQSNFTSTESDFPGFKNTYSYDYRLDSLAFARDKLSLSEVSDDIRGLARDDQPDIGAYERIDP